MSWILGLFIGFFIIPYFQDNFGRKYVFTLNMLASEVIMITIVQLPHKNSSKWILYTLILLTGLLSTARIMTGFNYMTELWPAKNLSTISSIFNIF